MERLGDPGFQYHRTLAQIWALLALELADRELLPFDFEVYARAVNDYVIDLEEYANSKGAKKDGFNLTALHRAVDEFTTNAAEFHAWGKAWEKEIGTRGFESNVMTIKRISHNSRMVNFESNLLDVDGGVSYCHHELCIRCGLIGMCSCLGENNLFMSYSHRRLGVDMKKHIFRASEMPSMRGIGTWPKNRSKKLRRS